MTMGFLPVLRFAEYGFGQGPQEEKLRRKFVFLTGMEYDDCLLPGELDRPEGSGFGDNPSKYYFYQDLLLGLFDGQLRDWDAAGHYGALRHRLREAVQRSEAAGKRACTGILRENWEEILRLYERLAGVLERKADLGKRLKQAYDRGEKEALVRLASEEIPECIRRVCAYRDSRETIWMRESKVFGFEVLDLRIGGLLARMERARSRVLSYTAGTIDRLPELEEERPVFDAREGGPGQCGCNSWGTIVSASPV